MTLSKTKKQLEKTVFGLATGVACFLVLHLLATVLSLEDLLDQLSSKHQRVLIVGRLDISLRYISLISGARRLVHQPKPQLLCNTRPSAPWWDLSAFQFSVFQIVWVVFH